ncbi:MAG TPA: M23 family metallopeptidase [Flavobacterium sp.]|jgi:hypothetical protein
MKWKLLLLLFINLLQAQTDYPKDYFRSPLDIPLSLSGNFGELRSNHFHSGLDFRTQQKEGLNVYASADGYIARIKISSFGNGKTIYINHPNGYTTVYCHLSKTNAIIDQYIKAIHYKRESYEIEVFPGTTELTVKKGDIIAFSGNSGGSGGPHLHFEIRNTKTEQIINPLLFGFDKMIPDSRKPILTSLLVYPLSDNTVVNESQKPVLVNMVQQSDGSYTSEKVLANGKIGFGIVAYDVFDRAFGKNGIYKIATFSNGNPSFSFQFDRFTFDETRYINALLDYPRLVGMGAKVQKLFMVNPYKLSIINTGQENGILDIQPNLSYTYKIEVADFNNNKVVVNVPIAYADVPAKVLKKEEKKGYFLNSNNDNNYKKDNVTVFIPAKTFYEDFYINFDVKNDTLILHNNIVGVHNTMAITFLDTTASEADKQKMFIATINNKKIKYNPTRRNGVEFITYTKNLGRFALAKDTVAPVVLPVNFKEGLWLTKQTGLVFTISDALSGIKEYKGYLNGKWVLFEYDYKTRKMVHDFDDAFLTDGKNDIKVIVTDNVGNSTIFESYFYRKSN